MVERYRPRTLDAVIPTANFAPKALKGKGVGRASIKKSTIDRVRREGKELRGKNVGDTFQNFALNLGIGTNNALTQSQYGFLPITRVRTLLDWIYRGSIWGRIAIDILAEDMTRGGAELLTVKKPGDVEKLQQGMVRLRCWKGLANAYKWSQLYGGSIAVLLIDGQDPSTPLRIETVGKNKFKGLTVFDRWMVDASLSQLVDAYGPHLGKPEFYTVVGDAPAMRGQRIHYTRCIRLEGMDLPYWQRIMENGWGLSVFEPLYDRMIAFDSATMGASQLIYKSYLRTYKLDGLHDAITSAGDAMKGIAQRVEWMRKYQGIEGLTLLDKEDDFATHEASGFSGIADVLVHFIEQISGALQIPLVRMLGQSPAGLNSTGESDLRTYYDNIIQRQESDFREGVNLIYRVLAQSLSIKLDDSFNFNFNPLWQLSETEKADVADKITRMILEAEAAGLISPQVALKELRQLSKVTGRWTNITDKEIEEASDVAEPPEPEGMEGEGGEEGQEGGEGQGEGSGKPGEKAPGEGKKPPKQSPQAREQGEIKGLENFKEINRAVGGKDSIAGDTTDNLPFTEIGGLQIVIETRAGTIRRGDGYSVRMPFDYGFIRRVPSAEGPEEWLDVCIGPNHSSRDVWVLDTLNPATGAFDEHKCLIGYLSARDAIGAFKKAYNDGAADRIGAVTHFDMSSLGWKNWIASGDKRLPLAPELLRRREAA